MLCENILFLRLLSIFNTAMKIGRFIVPILLITKLTLDVYHQIIDINDQSAKEKIIKRVSACVIIFLIPTIVNIFLGFLETITNMKFNYSECNANIKNISYYIEKKELEEKLLYEKESSENALKYQKAMQELDEQIKKNAANSSSDEASVIGQKYNLSNKELKQLCGVAKAEQGSIKGAKAEASLMANLYELLPSYSRYYKKGLVNYVRNSGWFANAGTHMSQGCPSGYLDAVRDVLVNGNRTLPLYVNEHDCIGCGDVLYITTNGKSANKNKRKDYIEDKTFVYTVYKKNDSVKYWIFQSFPDVRSDPFGYTFDAKEKLAKLNK